MFHLIDVIILQTKLYKQTLNMEVPIKSQKLGPLVTSRKTNAVLLNYPLIETLIV